MYGYGSIDMMAGNEWPPDGPEHWHPQPAADAPVAWLVWDTHSKCIVGLPTESVVREPTTVYRLRPPQWAKLVREAKHAHFGAHVALEVWKPTTATIAVVQWPHHTSSLLWNWKPSYVWCVCFELPLILPIDGDAAPHRLGGRRVLWPLEPLRECSSLQDVFKGDEQMQHSSLLGSLSYSNQVEVDGENRYNTDRGYTHADYPFPWAKHPHAAAVKEVDCFYTRIFLAGVLPDPSRNPERAEHRAEYLKLPDDQLGDLTFPRKRRKQKASLRPFDLLSEDVAHELLYNLARSYIHTPAYGAHRNWTAMRAVSTRFRDAANEAASDFVNQAASRLRSVEDFEEVYHIGRLRETVLPTGLDLWRVVQFASCGSLSGYSDRDALLAYMRLRGNLSHDDAPPEPPPEPPPCVDPTALVLMSYLHGGPGWYERRQQQLRYEHATRSKAPLLPAVMFKLRVEAWQVKMMAMRGWYPDDE